MTTLVTTRPWTRCRRHPTAAPHQVGDTCPDCGPGDDRVPASGITHRDPARRR